MRKLIEPIKKQKLIDMYNAGSTPGELAEIFDIYPNSVNRIIRNSGNKSNQLKKVSAEEIKIIIDRYENNESSELIAEDLKIDGTTICRILKRNGVIIRPASKNKRKYDIDESYFQKIDSAEKAYFLGFLYSDGNVSKEKNDIKISLKHTDDKILKQLSQLIYNFININYYKYGDNGLCVNLNITSQKMKQDLINIGCPPDKTFTIRYPNIEAKYDSHFIRGYFDGDGCISITKTERGTFDITSNTNFIYDVVGKFKNHIGIDLGIYINKDNNQTASTQTTDRDKLRLIFNFLYKDASLFMQRKYDKFYKQLYFISAKENKLDKDTSIDFWFNYFRDKEFPFPSYPNHILLNDWDNLCNLDTNDLQKDNIFSSYNRAGIKFLKHFNHHFFSISTKNKISMIDAFNNDDLLRKVIVNRLDGGFKISDNMLLQGMRNGFFAFHSSVFYPSVAKYIYDKYCVDNDIVYDYSSGFGQRMLGALSNKKNLKYIGCDPWIDNINAGNQIIKLLSTQNPGIKDRVNLICDGSENICLNEKVSIAFSSPPYFDKEIYEKTPSQAYYNGYDYFINTWWNKVCNNINLMLKSDGYFILNMKERLNNYDILNDMLNVCKKYGFIEIDRFYLQLSRNTAYMNREEIKLEPIIIMKRN